MNSKALSFLFHLLFLTTRLCDAVSFRVCFIGKLCQNLTNVCDLQDNVHHLIDRHEGDNKEVVVVNEKVFVTKGHKYISVCACN